MSSSWSSSNPTTRSRTLLFLSFRDSSVRSTRFSRPRVNQYEDNYNTFDENEGLINSAAARVSSDIDLPPKWVDIAEQVEDILASAQTRIISVEKLHAKHVLPGFTDRSSEEREIEAATSEITKEFRRCQSLIQRIGSLPLNQHRFPPSSNSRNEVLAAKNVQRGLAAKLQDVSASFRKKQRVYMEKLQGHAIKNQDLLIASGAIHLNTSEGITALDDDILAASRSQTQTQQQSGPDLSTRTLELNGIAQSIESLAELFKDLSVLVIDQGTLLDSVEYNIEQTNVHVEEARKELDVATKYQKNTGRRKCIFLLLLIIFGLVVILIFKPRRSARSPPAESPPKQQAAVVPDTSRIVFSRFQRGL